MAQEKKHGELSLLGTLDQRYLLDEKGDCYEIGWSAASS
jgi:hypothetical protein